MKYILSRNHFISLRPQQWVKNLFIFLPLIFGKKLFTFPANLYSLIAFILFSLNASAVYLINDIIDLEQDRSHPVKQLRPIASGKVPLREAKLLAYILSTVSIGCSLILSFDLGLIMIVYSIANFLYSKILKKIIIIDVLCLSGFFLLRIMAGSIAAGVKLSHWIISITALLTIFLGFAKRRHELRLFWRKAYLPHKKLPGYNIDFIDKMLLLSAVSTAAAYMFYTIDSAIVALFGNKNLIFTIPFVYFGIFRYLYLINKIGAECDPTHILLSDRPMQLNLLLWVMLCIAIIYFNPLFPYFH